MQIVYEDESWFSPLKVPRLRALSRQGNPQRIPARRRFKKGDPRSLVVYGALRLSDRSVDVWRSDGYPNSTWTRAFLNHLLRGATRAGKRWLVVIWDNASFHVSKILKKWMRRYNRWARKHGRTRIVPYQLPTASPWLNPIEPHWLHCKRAVYAVDHIPTIEEIRHAVDDYFDIRNAQHARNAMNS